MSEDNQKIEEKIEESMNYSRKLNQELGEEFKTFTQTTDARCNRIEQQNKETKEQVDKNTFRK